MTTTLGWYTIDTEEGPLGGRYYKENFKMAEEKNPVMEEGTEEEYFDTEIYTLTDEEGNDEEFELIGKYMENGVTYNALIPADEKKQNGEYIVLRREVDEDGEVYLVTIEDDDEFDRIADIFDESFNKFDYDGESE